METNPGAEADQHRMREALREAQRAREEDEVPVGAIVIWGDRIIGRGYNLTEKLHDVTAHAEMQAITAASNHLGGKYLDECTLYATLEPCVMCAGAIGWARVGRLVYGASDPKKGFSLLKGNILHPKTKIESGILEEECSRVLTEFFKEKRQ